jgi:hypothetical protein
LYQAFFGRFYGARFSRSRSRRRRREGLLHLRVRCIVCNPCHPKIGQGPKTRIIRKKTEYTRERLTNAAGATVASRISLDTQDLMDPFSRIQPFDHGRLDKVCRLERPTWTSSRDMENTQTRHERRTKGRRLMGRQRRVDWKKVSARKQ